VGARTRARRVRTRAHAFTHAPRAPARACVRARSQQRPPATCAAHTGGQTGQNCVLQTRLGGEVALH
jgi:hypothetical protein